MTRFCIECGKEFRTYPCKVRTGRGKYCSKRCSDKHTLLRPGQRLSVSTEFQKGKSHSFHQHITFAVSRVGGSPYKLVFVPNHPKATKRGYVREHRLVVEKYLGRYLTDSEVVHHVDGNTLNNRVENLRVLDKREHDRMNVKLNIHKRWNN